MEKSQNSCLLLLFLILLNVIIGCSSSLTRSNSEVLDTSNDFIFNKTLSKDSFSILKNRIAFLQGTYWPNNKIGMLIVPINDSEAIKLCFSYPGILITNSQCKYLNREIIENGKSYRFNDNGVLSHVFSYKNGILSGSYTSYFTNGNIESNGNYLNGDKYGLWEYFDIEGKKIKKEVFK